MKPFPDDMKLEHLRKKYRQNQKELKELRREVNELLKSYDGSRASGLWGRNIMPSEGWEQKLLALKEKLNPPKFRELKKRRGFLYLMRTRPLE